MDLDIAGIIQAAIDHLGRLGLFESVQGHEATSAPGNGLTADVWVDSIRPVPAQSGLAVSSAVLTLWARLYSNVSGPPTDNAEQTIAAAAVTVMASYSAGFTFAGLVTLVDLLGMTGNPLSVQGGYVNIGGVPCRCMTITIPCVVDDVWPQVF